MAINEPAPTNDRGFLLYGGEPIQTDYGHTIRVTESSSADGPHVWLFVDESEVVPGPPNPHLNLEQAIRLREALDQFIEGVPDRWTDGAKMLAEAKRQALGE
ncbi:hypothetical protein [Streptomyces sp. NPDC002994]|uniref:hypothetical protein n=1 Tax=Streptomyces sp. NPDC002994 TaxID=3154441 RepID=UPI0033B5B61D